MRQTCSVGPNSKARLYKPAAWLNNSKIVNDLRTNMVTCHRVDEDNMESIYGLMADDLKYAAVSFPLAAPTNR